MCKPFDRDVQILILMIIKMSDVQFRVRLLNVLFQKILNEQIGIQTDPTLR